MSGWVEGPVDAERPHLTVGHVDYPSPVALVGPEVDGAFVVRFLAPRDASDPAVAKVVERVTRDIDYYLVELGEPDPWGYAIYHSGTLSNVYSSVRWSYVDAERMRRRREAPASERKR
jgi:hypothetical protein